jgi:hypothetical protein
VIDRQRAPQHDQAAIRGAHECRDRSLDHLVGFARTNGHPGRHMVLMAAATAPPDTLAAARSIADWVSKCSAQLREVKMKKIRLLSMAIGLGLITSITQASAQQSPAIHVGSDTRAKSAADCMRDARFAITETGLQVTFTSGPHIAGSGTLDGAGVSVIVTCLSMGQRTFIEVVGVSLNSGAAEQARNRVRTVTMGPAT